MSPTSHAGDRGPTATRGGHGGGRGLRTARWLTLGEVDAAPTWVSGAVVMLVGLLAGCRADGARGVDPVRPVLRAPDLDPEPEPNSNSNPEPTAAVLPGRAPPCAPVEDLGVLFVGNSYMNLHALPERVANLGAAGGIAIDVAKVTMGGQSFEYHVARPKTAQTLAARPWDAVILQSHSLDPLRNREGFMRAGAQLGDSVREVGAEPLLFETWPRRAGHNLYNYFEPAGGTPKAMQAAVTARYASLAEAEHMRVVPVGRAWMQVLAGHPEIDLFANDGAHPSAAGAYLGACVVFSVLTRRPPPASRLAAVDVDVEAAAALRAMTVELVQPACGRQATG